MNFTSGDSWVLVVEDDPVVAKIIERSLNIPAVCLLDPAEIERLSPRKEPLGCFVDIYLGQGRNGLDFIPALRRKWPVSPVLVVTTDSTDEALEQAFFAGADDLIIKPVKPRELITRFQARLMALQKHAQGSSLTFCGLTLDKEHRIVSGPLGREFLPPIESLMLAALLAACGTVVAKESLKHEAWGLNAVSDNAFHRKLFELRRAVQAVSKDVSIRSLYGRGIVLDAALSGEDDLADLARPSLKDGRGSGRSSPERLTEI
jgi:two-component system OmpR family response regulator